MAVIAFVDAARLPMELTIAVFHVLFVFACVLIADFVWTLAPVALAVLHSIEELPAVRMPVGPSILSEAFSPSPLVLADIAVSIFELILAFSVPQTGLPLSFVPVPAAPDMLSESVRLIRPPLADIRVIIDTLPDAIAFLMPSHPLSIEVLAAGPRILALAPDPPVLIGSEVGVPIAEPLEACSVPFIVHPLALIYPGRGVDDDAQAVPLAVADLASVNGVLVGLDLEVLFRFQLFKVDEIGHHRGVLHVLAHVFFCEEYNALLLPIVDVLDQRRLLVHRVIRQRHAHANVLVRELILRYDVTLVGDL